MIIWPQRPKIAPDELAELERLGVEGVRDRLRRSAADKIYITHGPYRDKVCEWLHWKAAKSDLWIKAGVILAAIAAIAGVVAAIEGWPWPR